MRLSEITAAVEFTKHETTVAICADTFAVVVLCLDNDMWPCTNLERLHRVVIPDLGPIADTLIFSAIGLTLMYMMSYLYYSGKLGGGGKE